MPGVTPAEVLSNFGITLVEDPAENQPRLLVDLPAAELVEFMGGTPIEKLVRAAAY